MSTLANFLASEYIFYKLCFRLLTDEIRPVDVFLLLTTFSGRLEILPCANVNVDEQFQQTMLMTGEDPLIRLSFQKR